MEIPNLSDKMMDGTASVNKSPTLTWFFFPGGGEWKPMTIEAATREEAEEIHRQKRQRANEEVQEINDEKTNNE